MELAKQVGVQDSEKERFQLQSTDNTRFKVHSSAGGVHGREKRGTRQKQVKFRHAVQ